MITKLVVDRVVVDGDAAGRTIPQADGTVRLRTQPHPADRLAHEVGNASARALRDVVERGQLLNHRLSYLAVRGTMKPGDVFVLNAPYAGGTHLPDITVVTPVFDDAGKSILFFVGARGHHADVGGLTPGSMPPDSRTVKQEGVQELRRIVEHFGLDVVQSYMGHVQDNAEEQVRRVLDVLTDGEFVYPLDSGAEIAVRIRIDRESRSAVVDFSGTSPQQPDNFNAPAAVTRAAVLYVFRTLVDDEIPMNEGVLKPLELVVPSGSMLNPVYPAAVVAGNVETSQGTMNNFTFGDETQQYYETVCGGSGAGPEFDGTAAVQTHMTNLRLTDPEVLEWRFPVLLDEFRIRRGSGGGGRYRGGDGVVRRIRFTEPMTAAILSNHRKVAPFGLDGGQPGECGRNWTERDGTRVALSATDRVQMQPGDIFVIETPGGGGWGKVVKS